MDRARRLIFVTTNNISLSNKFKIRARPILIGILTAHRSLTGRRYYTHEQYLQVIGQKTKERKIVSYCRVSSSAQKKDLKAQRSAVNAFCIASGRIVHEKLEDIGSGLNYKRKNFIKILEMVEQGVLSEIIIAHKDRAVHSKLSHFSFFLTNRFSEYPMLSFIRTTVFFCLIYSPVFAANIKTFYGFVDVEEPVLLELIESPAFQRLKYIHQYGVAYYTTHCEEFTRYDHSLGVFFLLRANDCSLEEQIAGLLHDVSHTIFSHVGDWIFNRQNQEMDYQTLTHGDYLERSGLGNILRKHGYTVEKILPKRELFPALEQPLPTLCADRIDYNLQGAFYQGFITHEEAICMFHEIKFTDGEWISNDQELLKKLVRFSIFMSQNCWGSGTEYVLSMWLAEAILRGLDIQIISMDDIRFGIDQEIWDRLLISDDPLIQKNMHMISYPSNYHSFVSKKEANLFIISKFRGINPLIIVEGKRVRLTTTDPILAEEFQVAKERMSNGLYIKINTDNVEHLMAIISDNPLLTFSSL